MENILSGASISGLYTSTTEALTAISPYAIVCVGLLLAFLVIDIIINMLKKKSKMTRNNRNENEEDDIRYVPLDDEVEFDDEDLPYIDW